ncbi:HlyC/CorC family transporter [Candidatus Peregrinibacteria bacterium]|nr:MAG: HlyC/CorC family transporter [Candidatus Peregrinibacteria bacterium]
MLIFIIALMAASGMLSASEIALTTVTEPRLRAMQKEKRWGTNAITILKKTPQRVLIIILITNQMVNIVATVYATLLGIHWFGEGEITAFTAVFTVLLIAFGSIIPKTMALRFPEKIAQTVAYPLRWFVWGVTPVVIIFEKTAIMIRKLLKLKKRDVITATQNEIQAILQIGAEEGVISEQEAIFIQQILKFSKTETKDIMTLFKNIEAININATHSELVRFFNEHTHTHYPVFEEDLNNIKGVIDFHELVEATFRSKNKVPLLARHLLAPVVVPGSASLSALFKSLKEEEQRMAIVVDEHGQTIGVVTLGDLLKEATGMQVKKEVKEPKITKLDAQVWEADGEVTIGKINQTMKLNLDAPEHAVISLVVLEELKRFPEANEVIVVGPLEIKVMKLEKNIIKKVELKKHRQKQKNKDLLSVLG